MEPNQQLNAIFTKRWNEPALICDQREFTYAELYAQAAGIAEWMFAQGVEEGDVVAIRLPNGWPFAATYLACLIGRFLMVPINPELNELDQDYIIYRTSPRFIVSDEVLLEQTRMVVVDAPFFNYSKDSICAIFFTSGTTGRPKGVCHSLESLIGNVSSFNQALGINSEIRQYHVLPMAYMAGFLNSLLSPWVAGGVVLLGPRFRPMDVLKFWERPIKWKANSIWLTPTLASILARMSRDQETARKVGATMENVFCGTAPLRTSTRRAFFDAFGCPLQESYGMSEVLLVSAQTRQEAMHTEGVGRLLPDVRVEQRYVPDLGADELIIYSDFVLKKYLLEKGEFSPLLDDGAMPTGDQGDVHNDQLIITGRLKDLIIRGGLNISPAAIEDVILQQTGIEDATVVGVEHEVWGEIVVACVVASRGFDTAELQDALIERCRQELTDGTWPDKYIWLESLPRSSTGKIQKHILREQIE